MALSSSEKRFMRYWEDQRQGGKWSYIATYWFGYFIIVFMTGVALGLFTGLRFVTKPILATMLGLSAVGAFLIAYWQWNRQQNRFKKIIQNIVEKRIPS